MPEKCRFLFVQLSARNGSADWQTRVHLW